MNYKKEPLMKSELHCENLVSKSRVSRGLTLYPRKSIKAEMKS